RLEQEKQRIEEERIRLEQERKRLQEERKLAEEKRLKEEEKQKEKTEEKKPKQKIEAPKEKKMPKKPPKEEKEESMLVGQRGKVVLDATLDATKESLEEEYRVKPFDIITVKVYQEDELSGDYKVQKGGFIDMPLIRKVQVEGLTVYEIEDKITALLEKDYLTEPQVMVIVKEFHSENVVVLGQVTKPGTYEFSTEQPITLLQAISRAGGFTNIAAINKVKIIRMEGDKKVTIQVKTGEIIDGKKKDILLKSGDMIVVPESFW
ncbi:MAG: polysaccharide export protein, partial [Candidatus Omnitrophica bacterium]|nr:polysaccharide export protein [Candidatus Omnitrophota bacterium]